MRAVDLVVTLLVSASMNAVAQAPDARALAAGCASCHRPDGTTIPSLNGRSRAELRAKLRAFRDGSQAGTVMPQLSRGYTEAELDAITAWYAKQPAGAR
jgi:cytochrome c553